MNQRITRRRRAARTKIAPYIRAEEPTEGKLNRHWRAVFLDTLAATSNVAQAAKAAGVAPGRAYRVRRSEPAFERAWFAALCEGYDHLELDVVRRLRDADFAAPAGGRYDFGPALRLLAAHRATIGRHRGQMLEDDEEAVLASIDATLDRILKREAAAAELEAAEPEVVDGTPRLPSPGSAENPDG